MRRIMVSGLLVLMLAVPIAASAQTLDVNAQLISLLQQIVRLQTQLIQSLQNQLAQLSAQLASWQNTSSGALTTPRCKVIAPPTCSTMLAVTYDANNCVSGYFCAAEATSPPPPATSVQTGASCRYYNCKYYAEGSLFSACCGIYEPSFVLQACPYRTGSVECPTLKCQGGLWYRTDGKGQGVQI